MLIPRGCFGFLAFACLIGGFMGLAKGIEPGAAWFMIICASIGILRYFFDGGER